MRCAASVARWYPVAGGDAATAGVVCHGDVHPGNVLPTADGPVLLDWDLLCRGPVAWDHGPLMTWTARWGGEPGIYERFAEGYGDSLRGDPLGEAVAELRLVAATLMRVRAGRTDPLAAAEAERRLRWWRGDPTRPRGRPSRPADRRQRPIAPSRRLARRAEVAGAAGERDGLHGVPQRRQCSRWYT